MPPSTTYKKKNKQKKKGSSSAAACDEVNLNTQVYEALTRLADTLAQLDERHNPPSESLSPGDDSIVKSSEGDASGNADSGEDEIVKLANDTAAMDLHPTTKSETEISPSTATDNDTLPVETATKDGQAEETTTVINPASSLPISHWRILPLEVESVYQLLNDGAEYIHATSTKYALVGKVDLKEGGNLAVRLLALFYFTLELPM